MKSKIKIAIVVCLSIILIAGCLNWKYEVISIHPLFGNEHQDLKVMTWNIHCSKGTDSIRQRKIAELILEVDADFVQLNEFYLKGCLLMDSILRTRYPYTEKYQSYRISGDIFYSKRVMSNSGHVHTPKGVKGIQTIKATIPVENDSVQIFGVHMASNRYEGNSIEKVFESDTISFDRYKGAQELRCYQALRTKEALLESDHPVIVMGDMNDFNCSAPLDTLTTCGLKDAWWEGGFGYGHTFHDGWLRLRIDHILHSKELKLESVKVIDTNLSDHNPVVAGFSVKN